MIELTFETTDPDEIERCRRYWELEDDGTFKESITAVREPGSGSGKHDRGFFESVTARDTRRRCPTCGTPRIVANRDSYLAPLQPPSPCYLCLHAKKHLIRSMRTHSTEQSSVWHWDGSFSFPLAALALLHSLGRTIHRRELRCGFSISDCAGFAPAHLHRFLSRLYAAHMIEKSTPGIEEQNVRAETKYRVISDPILEQDLARYERLLAEGASFNHHGLQDLWLDYAVAECVAYICGQSALFGLPINPEDEKLCSALRLAVRIYSIGEVWAVSLRCIEVAASLIERGFTAEDAAANVPAGIAQHCLPPPGKLTIPEPILRSIRDPRTSLRDWFDDWYGICEYTRGKTVADLFHGLHNTRTPHEAVTAQGDAARPLEYMPS